MKNFFLIALMLCFSCVYANAQHSYRKGDYHSHRTTVIVIHNSPHNVHHDQTPTHQMTNHGKYAEYDFEDESNCNQYIQPSCDLLSYNEVEYTIWFKNNHYKLRGMSDVINLHNVADIVSKHPNIKVVVYGFASAQVGTTKYNDILARKRTDEVVNYLVNGCHVNWSNIKVVNKGSRDAHYDIDEWNQSVVIKFE